MKILYYFLDIKKDFIYENKNYTIKLDMTITKENNSFKKLLYKKQNFEIELEAFSLINNNKINNKKFIKFHEIILKILYKNRQILNEYKKLVNYNDFYTMNPISLNKETYIEKIPYYYSVTDKADGDKVQLFIFQKKFILLLQIKKL